MARLDAVIVGSGPNGLAAAIAIAQTGRKVIAFEAAETIGGGCRSEELTLPGFVHDVCSAVHPFAVVSPFFRSLPLAAHGLEWIRPPVMLAHPIDDAVVAENRRCRAGSIAVAASSDRVRTFWDPRAATGDYPGAPDVRRRRCTRA